MFGARPVPRGGEKRDEVAADDGSAGPGDGSGSLRRRIGSATYFVTAAATPAPATTSSSAATERSAIARGLVARAQQ